MFGTSRINPGPAPLPPGSPLRIRTKDADQFNANSGDVEVRCRCHDTCEVCFSLSRAAFTRCLTLQQWIMADIVLVALEPEDVEPQIQTSEDVQPQRKG